MGQNRILLTTHNFSGFDTEAIRQPKPLPRFYLIYLFIFLFFYPPSTIPQPVFSLRADTYDWTERILTPNLIGLNQAGKTKLLTSRLLSSPFSL